MKVEVESEDKGTLIIKIEDSRHTLPNMIRRALWEDPSVTFAAYEKKHPFLGAPRLIIRAKDPKKALFTAIKKTEEDLKKFESEFNKVFKK